MAPHERAGTRATSPPPRRRVASVELTGRDKGSLGSSSSTSCRRGAKKGEQKMAPHERTGTRATSPPPRRRVVGEQTEGNKKMASHERAGTRATSPPPRRCVASSSTSCRRGAKKRGKKIRRCTNRRGKGTTCPRLLLVVMSPTPRRRDGEQKKGKKKMASHEREGTRATSPPPRRRVASSSTASCRRGEKKGNNKKGATRTGGDEGDLASSS